MTVRGKTKEITCKCGCGKKKMVRVADINRGWGLFYSKSCKARWQEKQTGQYKAFINMSQRRERDEIDYEGPGWDAHKDMW
jgi:hypothetical protein